MKLFDSIFNMTCFSIIIITIVLSFNVHADQNDSIARGSLNITDSNIIFTPYNDYSEITCVGKVVNKSDVAIKDVVFQVQYFNSTGAIIDSVTGYEYSYIVPPKEEIAFRVSGTAARALNEEYVSHKVIITSAKLALPSSSRKKKNNFIIELLISWTPMLLLIAVWIFFMRKHQGKNSPQKKIIEIQEKQYEITRQQNELFTNLIETIKNK